MLIQQAVSAVSGMTLLYMHCVVKFFFSFLAIFLSILLARSYPSNTSDIANLTMSKSFISRTVAKSVQAVEQGEGVGVTVRRSIGTPRLRNLSPFLMLYVRSLQ